MEQIITIAKKYADELFIKPIEGAKSIVMLVFLYQPFEALNRREYAELDAYYLVSNTSYHKAQEFIKELKECKIDARYTNDFNYKKFAVSAGFCGVGKNTLCYIQGEGSRFVMQAVMVDGQYEYMPKNTILQPDCDACNLCLRACPVRAIKDSTNEFKHTACLRYLQEGQEVLDEKQLKAMQNKFLGCDICQAVCPYNKADKVAVPQHLKEILRLSNLLDILSDKQKTKEVFEGILGKNYARQNKLLKQALVVAGASKNKDLLKQIQPFCTDEDDLIRQTAQIACKRLSS